MNYKQI